jgi:hypothetical protein
MTARMYIHTYIHVLGALGVVNRGSRSGEGNDDESDDASDSGANI